MSDAGHRSELQPNDLVDILEATAALLMSFHHSDVALQNALSTLAARARATPEMVDLQHVDLVTQAHSDLARLMSELAACLAGRPTRIEDLKSALTLRSLRESLIESSDAPGPNHAPGDLLLF